MVRLLSYAGAIVLSTLLVNPARGQMFAGYDQFCGVPVVVVPNPQLASAAFDQFGNPVIYIDPSAMADWSHSRIFSLAHECGHHKLGHSTPQGMWFRNTQMWATRAQELQADCWAAQALKLIWAISDLNRVVALFRSQGSSTSSGYPSGIERAETIARCANATGGNIGSTTPSASPEVAAPESDDDDTGLVRLAETLTRGRSALREVRGAQSRYSNSYQLAFAIVWMDDCRVRETHVTCSVRDSGDPQSALERLRITVASALIKRGWTQDILLRTQMNGWRFTHTASGATIDLSIPEPSASELELTLTGWPARN